MENPQTGLLKTRAVVAGLPWKDVTYCSYGTGYRKLTRVWTNCERWRPRPLCDGKTCPSMVGSKHRLWAQRGSNKRQSYDGRCSLDELHSIPRALVEEIESAVSQ